MNEEMIKIIAAILNDNLGNRITVALGNGIINVLSNSMTQMQGNPTTANTPSPSDS